LDCRILGAERSFKRVPPLPGGDAAVTVAALFETDRRPQAIQLTQVENDENKREQTGDKLVRVGSLTFERRS